MTTIVDETLTTGMNLFEEIAWKKFCSAGLAALFVSVPAFAVWPINMIVTYIVDHYTSALFQVGRKAVDLKAIYVINEGKEKDFDNEDVKLKFIEKDFGLKSPEYLKARALAHDSFAEFVRVRGA